MDSLRLFRTHCDRAHRANLQAGSAPIACGTIDQGNECRTNSRRKADCFNGTGFTARLARDPVQRQTVFLDLGPMIKAQLGVWRKDRLRASLPALATKRAFADMEIDRWQTVNEMND
jgi:hypothetical protein